MAAARRRFKIPVLTGGALAIGLESPLRAAFAGDLTRAGDHILRNYTGFSTDGSFFFQRMYRGLIPLLAVNIIGKTGLLKGTNQSGSQFKWIDLSEDKEIVKRVKSELVV